MRLCQACFRHKSYTRSRLCARCRKERERALARVRVRRLRGARGVGQPPPTTDRPADPQPGPESVEQEYVADSPAPTLNPPSETWEPSPDFDPYTQPIPGFEGDLEWLRKTQLGLDGPWVELFGLSHEGAERWDPRVVAALALLEEGWRVYGPTFEERTAFGPRGKEQAAIWRPVIERLLSL
jgi:hypothetical protein